VANMRSTHAYGYTPLERIGIHLSQLAIELRQFGISRNNEDYDTLFLCSLHPSKAA
jgi:hypothetical protein